jgi:hypothetical protein
MTGIQDVFNRLIGVQLPTNVGDNDDGVISPRHPALKLRKILLSATKRFNAMSDAHQDLHKYEKSDPETMARSSMSDLELEVFDLWKLGCSPPEIDWAQVALFASPIETPLAMYRAFLPDAAYPSDMETDSDCSKSTGQSHFNF